VTGHGSDAIRDRKRELRTRVLRERDAVPPSVRAEDSVALAKRLLDLPETRAARTVAAFSSFGSEVDTTPITGALHDRGVTVVLPYLEGGVLRMAEHRPGGAMIPTSYGAAEPAARVPTAPASIDLVVVPGVAFDRHGNRIGYGRGYYDGFVRTLRPSTPRVAVAFAAQLVEDVPHGPTDERVDMVVTPAEVIRCRPPRARHNH